MTTTDRTCSVPGCVKLRGDRQRYCPMHSARWRKYKSFDLPERAPKPKDQCSVDDSPSPPEMRSRNVARMATLNARGWSLSVEQDGVWVETGVPTIDPSWRYTDRAGHEHHGGELLVHALDDPDDEPFYFDDDGEEYNSPSHLECKLCGEWITPAPTWPPPQWMPTHRTATVDISFPGQMQRWTLFKPELIERLATNPDLAVADVAAIVQRAGETGDAMLIEAQAWL